jgi:hypothetical protein
VIDQLPALQSSYNEDKVHLLIGLILPVSHNIGR